MIYKNYNSKQMGMTITNALIAQIRRLNITGQEAEQAIGLKHNSLSGMKGAVYLPLI